MNIYKNIKQLVNYAIKNDLVDKLDEVYVTNGLFDCLQVTHAYVNEEVENDELQNILNKILDYAIQNKIIEDSVVEKDLLTGKIMGVVTPNPSVVTNKFYLLYENDKISATNYFYNLSKNNNYIMMDRVNKNIKFDYESQFGCFDITINVSKPEKNPRDIEKAKSVKNTGYPKCLLCKENVGFSGNLNHPARQNLRTIPLVLNDEKFQLQYSPYVYYNEHSIVFKEEHEPMKIDTNTFKRLLDFVEIMPHYFIGSNADLPIVGGSILSHEHYQAGHYELPMARANKLMSFKSNEYKCDISILKWPLSVIRLKGDNKDELIKLSTKILNKWIDYTDEKADVISHTDGVRHNTITPIARTRNGKYEIDLALRNNRVNEKHKLGIFHPHDDLHHIKKENIGLIEVMGLGILPKRLILELKEISEILADEKIDLCTMKNNIHYEWIVYLVNKYGRKNDKQKIDTILKDEVGRKFERCLIDAGVFKQNDDGIKCFEKFMLSLQLKRED